MEFEMVYEGFYSNEQKQHYYVYIGFLPADKNCLDCKGKGIVYHTCGHARCYEPCHCLEALNDKDTNA